MSRELSSDGSSRPAASGSPDDLRSLWRAFREASSPETYYAGWLAVQCAWIGEVHRGLVLAPSAGAEALTPVASWPPGEPPGAPLAKAAEKALSERRPLALQLEPQPGRAASSHTCIAQPIESPLDPDGDPFGVVVLDLAPRSPSDLEHALRQLSWGSAWLELAALRESGQAGSLRSNEVLQIVAAPLDHAAFPAAARALVTDLAARFGCDRVSLGAVDRGRVRLQAVSHSALFGERANLTRAIEAAMEEALDQESVVVHPPRATSSSVPVQVTRAHQRLCEGEDDEAGPRTACSIPIAHGDAFRAIVTLERPGNRPFEATELKLVESAVSLVGPTLDLQRREDRWLGAKLLDSARRLGARLVGPGHVGLKLAMLAAVALVLIMTFVDGDYRVTADASLEATVLRAAVAPFDGFLAEAPARAGDRVETGDVLATLDDRELRLERSRWSSQLEQLRKEYRQAMASREAAEVRIYAAQMNQARAQLALAEAKLEKMVLRAPFDGVVVTGDLSQELGSPVERGELLYEVAPRDDYRLVLEVDERDIDEIAVGHTGSMVFSAFPGESVDFEVEQLTPVSTPREGRNTFRVEARLLGAPADLQPGMEGVGKIAVDRRRLLWIWTHEIVDWLRLAFWRWLP